MYKPKSKRILISLCFIILSVFILSAVFVSAEAINSSRNISSSVLRLHIVANSDTDSDQSVKLKVRDAVLSRCGYLFAGSKDAAESARRAEKYKNVLRTAARDELLKNGFLTPVSVQVEECPFPSKSYGAVRLPAGRYTAVNIRLGAASGQNWWCVMYPPLCLTSDTVKADEKTLSLLRRELSAEEYALVTEQSELKINMKFKIAEILGKYFK